jgi:hypothetical protein
LYEDVYSTVTTKIGLKNRNVENSRPPYLARVKSTFEPPKQHQKNAQKLSSHQIYEKLQKIINEGRFSGFKFSFDGTEVLATPPS